jgi:succinate dehydrogenase/fumarate reductase flavoprotein subunit
MNASMTSERDHEVDFVVLGSGIAALRAAVRLLRAHGLIYRVGRTNYYRPTQKGYEVMSTALKFRQADLTLLAA